MRRLAWLEGTILGLSALLTLWGLQSYGLWDPWELDPNRLSQRLLDAFGPSEGLARAPGALAGLVVLGIVYALVRRSAGRGTAVVAVAVACATPLFILNARLAMGDTVGMAAQGWVGLAALSLIEAERVPAARWVAAVLLVAGVAVSVMVSGALLGPLPPLLAVAAWSVMSDDTSSAWAGARWVFVPAVCGLGAGVVVAVLRDAPDPTVWLGGGVVEGEPPTWAGGFEALFHGFAPWSAALPVAAMSLLDPRTERSETAQRTGWILLLWVSVSIVSWSVFSSRYGSPPFLALVPIAALVGTWLREMTRSTRVHSAAAVTVALLVGLAVRDYALFPESPLRSVRMTGFSMPEAVSFSAQWAALFVSFAATLVLALISTKQRRRPNTRRTLQALAETLQAPWPGRGWAVLLVGGLVACLVFGLLCFAVDLPIASVAVRTGQALFFLPWVVVGAIVGLPWLAYGYGQLGDARVVPVLGISLAAGAFIAGAFIPALSQHLSPRPVFEAYARLNDGRDEPLRAYRTSIDAAPYYVGAPVERIDDKSELLSFLDAEGQRWAVLPSNELARVDHAYRKSTGGHLFVADATSEHLLLASARPVDGLANQNVIARTVLVSPPEPQRPTDAAFDDRIELLGYDLDLPGGDSVGAGQRVRFTWYWRVVGKPPVGHEVFVHIEGHGFRLNGDHKPVGGRYPAPLWERGDILVDEHELLVPANYPPDDYPIYVGWFKGSRRLPVTSGTNTDEDRAEVGSLPIR